MYAENAVKIHRMHVEYKEGWVEFCDKSMAENVATLLNNTQVGFWQLLILYLHFYCDCLQYIVAICTFFIYFLGHCICFMDIMQHLW